MVNPTTSLNATVKRAVLRDKAAQESIYRQYFGYAWEVARRYARPDRPARQIVADAFFHLFLQLNTFDPTHAGFKTFLKNKVIDSALRNRSITYVPTVLNMLKAWDQLVPAAVEPALQQLPPGVHMVLVLDAVEGFGYTEIAQRLQLTDAKSLQELVLLTQYIRPYQPLILKKIQSLPPADLPDLDMDWVLLKEKLDEKESEPPPRIAAAASTAFIPEPIDPVEGQWTGWAFLFILIAASLFMLYMAGIIR